MARDRSKPWGQQPDDDSEHTEAIPGAWDDEATQNAAKRRAPRRGARRNDDETNVGGSLLPGDDFGLAKVFEQALAPAYVSEPADEVERTEPVASVPSPQAPPSAPVGAKPAGKRPPPPRPEPKPAPPPPRAPEPQAQRPAPPPPPPTPAPSFEEDLGLGPVEEFTISGLMPDELKAMTEAARDAVKQADRQPAPPPQQPVARSVHADPPRTSRHDPDPLITGVLAPAGGPPPGITPGIDDEETLSMNVQDSPDLLEQLRPSGNAGRDFHTFGAGLQRLDQLPDVPKSDAGGGILELLDGTPEPASPTAPNPAPGAPASEPDRPRRVSTNRAGSMGRTSRAPTPTPARQRSVAPNPKGATPRPAPARAERPSGSLPPRDALRRSGDRGGKPQAATPAPAPRPAASGRAMDEEARIRAALASVSEDEHTSWVKLDEPDEPSAPAAPEPTSRPPGNRPRAQRPDAAMPGVTPMGMPRQEAVPAVEREPSLTMDLTEVKPADEPTRPVDMSDIGDEATIPNPRSSLGDEVTVPARPPGAGDDETVPVKVPNTRAKEEPPAETGPASKPPPAKPPGAKPPPKAPPAAGAAPPKGKSKPPIDISPLGEEKAESYRDGALPWIASMFAVMVIGTGVMLFLIMLLYLI